MAKGVEAVIATGRALIECKAALPHGEFEQAVAMSGLALRDSQRYMSVAHNPAITKATHVSLLPQAYTTLHELSRLEPEVLEEAIAEGTVRPDMTRAEAQRLRDPEHVETTHHRKNDPEHGRWVCPLCHGKGWVDKEPREGSGRYGRRVDLLPGRDQEVFDEAGPDPRASRPSPRMTKTAEGQIPSTVLGGHGVAGTRPARTWESPDRPRVVTLTLDLTIQRPRAGRGSCQRRALISQQGPHRAQGREGGRRGG